MWRPGSVRSKSSLKPNGDRSRGHNVAATSCGSGCRITSLFCRGHPNAPPTVARLDPALCLILGFCRALFGFAHVPVGRSLATLAPRIVICLGVIRCNFLTVWRLRAQSGRQSDLIGKQIDKHQDLSIHFLIALHQLLQFICVWRDERFGGDECRPFKNNWWQILQSSRICHLPLCVLWTVVMSSRLTGCSRAYFLLWIRSLTIFRRVRKN